MAKSRNKPSKAKKGQKKATGTKARRHAQGRKGKMAGYEKTVR